VTNTGRAFPFWESCSLHLAEFVRNPGVPIVGVVDDDPHRNALSAEIKYERSPASFLRASRKSASAQGLDVSQFCLCCRGSRRCTCGSPLVTSETTLEHAEVYASGRYRTHHLKAHPTRAFFGSGCDSEQRITAASATIKAVHIKEKS
jgi:hypothetical protein